MTVAADSRQDAHEITRSFRRLRLLFVAASVKGWIVAAVAVVLVGIPAPVCVAVAVAYTVGNIVLDRYFAQRRDEQLAQLRDPITGQLSERTAARTRASA
jgi:hypothetical protein